MVGFLELKITHLHDIMRVFLPFFDFTFTKIYVLYNSSEWNLQFVSHKQSNFFCQRTVKTIVREKVVKFPHSVRMGEESALWMCVSRSQ